MGFKNDHNAFVKAIAIYDIKNVESIFSQCDSKNYYIQRALEKYDYEKIQEVFEGFVSIGLKRNALKVLKEYEKTAKHTSVKKEVEYKKVVLTHQKNAMKNKLYHLSGSSFENEKASKEEILFALENTIKKEIA